MNMSQVEHMSVLFSSYFSLIVSILELMIINHMQKAETGLK